MSTNEKQCLTCNKKIIGRSDKKFCNDFCRNEFNNKTKAAANNYVRKIDHILKKNRKILEKLLGDMDKRKYQKSKLQELEFSFKYFTHTYETKKGDTYKFCYEFGYLLFDEEWLVIVAQFENNKMDF